MLLALVLLAATPEHANGLFQAKQYAEAAAAYAELRQQQPQNPLFALRQGAALLALGRADEALPLFDAAGSLGFPMPLMQAWAARAHVRRGRLDEAVEALKAASARGFANVALLDGEADFEPLRRDPRFPALREAVDRNARPCAHAPEFRQLDFWLGHWTVSASGAPAGESHVEKILGECVVFENWTGAGGVSGKSFNTWHAPAREWRQSWYDSRGMVTEYHGAFADKQMVFVADTLQPGPDGQLRPARQRMTFFDQDGTVRQLGERSADGGATWQITYDLLYTRKPAK
jgi:tetratricopeptide (TPR) repeat protein